MKRKILTLVLAAFLLTGCGTVDEKSSSDKHSSSSSSQNNNTSSEIPNRYLITFKDENGITLEAKEWEVNSTPSYTYVKADTAEWDYTMNGWSSTQGGEILSSLPVVTQAFTYYAVVSSAKQTYTITFNSNGGTSIASMTREYGVSIQKPTDPTKNGFRFIAWSSTSSLDSEVTWPVTITKNETYYASWNEIINIKGYLATLLTAATADPYSYIPSAMRPDNSQNYVSSSDVNYDLTKSTSVSTIKYGGFGEQWNMVTDNIRESERFYAVLTLVSATIDSSVVLFNNYLDSNPSNTADHALNETAYTARIVFSNGILSYSIRLKTSINVPLFGNISPQIDMVFNTSKLEKYVRIQLTENNAMKYAIKENYYSFALEYGIESVSRKAHFEITRANDQSITGHIYEFVQLKGKDLIPSCADFYINDTYTSVAGNKANGMIGFAGYINELYKTDKGKLLGYEVRETIEKWGLSDTYYTLWFNLNNINGISSIKATSNDNNGVYGNNDNNIYVNGNSSIFEPMKNGTVIKTSRKYDIELRKQYFYGISNSELMEYETSIPMMFIQVGNLSTFSSDILSKNGISASVGLTQTFIDKIENDSGGMVDTFIANRNHVTSVIIQNYIGTALAIS